MSIDDRKPENRTEYQKYITSLGYDTTNSFQLLKNYYDSISVMPYTINTYKLKYNTKASPIQIRVYDSTGAFLNGYEQCFGDIKRLRILDSFPLKIISHLPINYNLSLQKDIKLFVNNITDQNKIINDSKSKKYTFIIFYAKWAGYYSKNTLEQLRQHISTNLPNVQLIKVNTSPALN